MKTHHLSGFGISTAIHAGLALLLVPVLFAQEPQPEEPPLLPVELSMFEPKAPEPAPEPVPQVAPEPPPPPPPPPPKPKQQPKEKPKPKPDKPVEKPLPKPPEKDLRKEQEERERLEALQRQREEQQRQERAEAERQARLQAQQQAARAAAPAQNEVPLITNPRYRRPPRAPDYPRRALESGTEGTVIVRANVSTSGSVISAQVHQSSGNTALDAAAVKAVRGWAFVPASRGGQNIASIVQVPVNFRLK